MKGRGWKYFMWNHAELGTGFIRGLRGPQSTHVVVKRESPYGNGDSGTKKPKDPARKKKRPVLDFVMVALVSEKGKQRMVRRYKSEALEAFDRA